MYKKLIDEIENDTLYQCLKLVLSKDFQQYISQLDLIGILNYIDQILELEFDDEIIRFWDGYKVGLFRVINPNRKDISFSLGYDAAYRVSLVSSINDFRQPVVNSQTSESSTIEQTQKRRNESSITGRRTRKRNVNQLEVKEESTQHSTALGVSRRVEEKTINENQDIFAFLATLGF